MFNPLNRTIVGILVVTGGKIGYSGTRGQGPVLSDGKHAVHIAECVSTFDNVNNPFGDSSSPEKIRNYDDIRPVIAIKYSNKDGAVTERYHFFGFMQFSELSEDDKASGKYKPDPDTGYALERMLDAKGEIVKVPKGTVDDKGNPEMRTAVTRVVSEKNTEIAQRILKDALVAARVPATTEEMEIDEFIKYAVAGINKCTGAIEITVTSTKYDGKTISRVQNPREVGTSVPTEATAEAAAPAVTKPVAKVNDDF